ncbi:MAG: exodeoxyribonuclease VII small subunit [Patescibacteria group bacterium]
MKKEEKKDIQSDFQRLEEISGKLENKDLNLEESIELFEEGAELIKRSYKKLGKVKNRFREIKEDLEKEIPENLES